MTGRQILTLAVFSVLASNLGGAQSAAYVHTISIGSEGSGVVRAPDAEDDLEDVHRHVVRLAGLRPKIQLTVSASTSGSVAIGKRLAGLAGAADSTDLVVGVVRGAWSPDRSFAENASLSGLGQEPITADYLLHLTMFLPVHNAVLFVLSPDQFEFPRNALTGIPTGVEGGGKYIITIRLKEGGGFQALADRFTDLLDSDWDDRRSDQNGDAKLVFSEWLASFARNAAAAGLTGSIFRVTGGSDLFIKQLQ